MNRNEADWNWSESVCIIFTLTPFTTQALRATRNMLILAILLVHACMHVCAIVREESRRREESIFACSLLLQLLLLLLLLLLASTTLLSLLLLRHCHRSLTRRWVPCTQANLVHCTALAKLTSSAWGIGVRVLISARGQDVTDRGGARSLQPAVTPK